MLHRAIIPAAALAALLVLAQAAEDMSWKINAKSKKEAKDKSQLLTDITRDNAKLVSTFQSFKRHYRKAYNSSKDEARAIQNFKLNMQQVIDINNNDTLGFWASGNVFSDLSFQEFAALYLINKDIAQPNTSTNTTIATTAASSAPLSRSATITTTTTTLPVATAGTYRALRGTATRTLQQTLATDVDWVAKGKVTPVKQQGQCGSCWAFSGMAAIESAYLIAYPSANTTSIDLSEQQAVSCMTSTNGCSGGWPEDVYNYAAATAVTVESVYGYSSTSGVTGTCQLPSLSATLAQPGRVVQLSRGSTYVYPANNQAAVLTAVAKQPATFYFEVTASFQNYAGGVYSATDCGTAVNHAMLMVGYSTSNTSNKYFKLKNSWGPEWGEAGFARVGMTGDGPGACGAYMWVAYPPLTFKTVLADQTPKPSPSPSPKPSPSPSPSPSPKPSPSPSPKSSPTPSPDPSPSPLPSPSPSPLPSSNNTSSPTQIKRK